MLRPYGVENSWRRRVTRRRHLWTLVFFMDVTRLAKLRKRKNLVAGRVRDGAHLAVDRVDVAAEEAHVPARHDAPGGHVLAEPVEDVHLLRFRRVNVERAAGRRIAGRQAGRDGPESVVGLVADVQHPGRVHGDGRDGVEPRSDGQVPVLVVALASGVQELGRPLSICARPCRSAGRG